MQTNQLSGEQQYALITNAMSMRYQLIKSALDTTRDIDKECGYPDKVDAAACKALYKREGIAKRVVNIMPDESWKYDPEVLESEDVEEETAFEKEWKAMVKKFNLYAILKRADRLSGVGTYGVILLGLSDGKTPDNEVAGVTYDVEGNLTGFGKAKLLYLRTFDETQVQIAEYDTDPKSFRFGRPLFYNINFTDINDATGTTSPQPAIGQTKIHWHRIVHLADNLESSEVFGVMRMEPVFNRLYDLRKVLSASGEMFWKGGFPGLSFETQPEFAATAELDKDSLRKEMEEYSMGLQRYIATVGMNVKSLAPQVVDPGPTLLAHIKAICISLGIPYRIFLGSEEAQLAGEQDASAWNERLDERRTKYITPHVLTTFVMALIAVGAISPIKDLKTGIIVNWKELHNPSAKEKADVAKVLTEAMTNYVQSGGDVLMQPHDFLTRILGFTDEQAESILEKVDEAMSQMQEDQPEVDENGDPIHKQDQTTEGVPGSRFGKKKTTKTPADPKADPKDTALEREQKAADIQRTKAEAEAKLRKPGKK